MSTHGLADFLVARLAEDEERKRDALFLEGVPEEDRERAREVMSQSLAWAVHDLRAACRALGWAVVAITLPPLARKRALRYASHPDYRTEWHPHH